MAILPKLQIYSPRILLATALLCAQPGSWAYASYRPVPAQLSTSKRSDRLGAALYTAAEQGDLAQMQALLGLGADPNFRHPRALYSPVLLRAISSGQRQAVRLLLSQPEIRVDAKDGRGTPILIAATSLVESSPRSERIIDCIALALRHGQVNPNSRDSAYVGDDRGALHIAAASGSLRLVRILLRAGADPNRANRHDETPLFFAAERGHTEIAYELITAGARPESYSRHTRMTPLMVAAENGRSRVVKLLLQMRADARSRNAFGKTALDLAREGAARAQPPYDGRVRHDRVIRLLERT